MTFEEYIKHDAIGLAELIKNGEITPEEILNIAINRSEETNSQTNAIIHKLHDFAKKSIDKRDKKAVFSGVPFLMKDIGDHLKGAPMNFGCNGYENFVSTEDSISTERIKKAGLITFGKTNTPEFGLTPYTEPKLHGPTRNPWDLDRSAGGSSGGSAAAVAAGVVPLATANDGGGSIRIPASCCGLFGLKPSRGRISLGNLEGESWSGAVMGNCVSRSVRDSAAYLDAVQGASYGEPYLVQQPDMPYSEEIKIVPGKLKIAYSTAHSLDHEVDNECIKAIDNTVQLLKTLGHEVTEVKLPWNKDDLKVAFTTVLFGEIATEIKMLEQYLGRKVTRKDIEINTWSMGLLGRTYKAGDFSMAKRQWGKLSRNLGVFHKE